jgi:hypothetical protein
MFRGIEAIEGRAEDGPCPPPSIDGAPMGKAINAPGKAADDGDVPGQLKT